MASRAMHEGRVPQPGIPTGKRNAPKGKIKRAAPPKQEVAGPYRSQSSVPKIRRAATPREHRKEAPPATKGKIRRAPGPFAVAPLHPTTPAETHRRRKEEAAIHALLKPKVKPTPPPIARSAASAAFEEAKRKGIPDAKAAKIAAAAGGKAWEAEDARRQTASTPKPTKGDSWSPGDPIALAVEKDIIQPQQEAGHIPKSKTIGQKIYQRVAEWGPTVLTGGPEAKAAFTGLKAGLAGAESEGITLGGSKLLKGVLRPTQAVSADAKAAITARAEQKAAQAAESGVKAVAKKAGRVVVRATPKADRAVARQVAGASTRKEAAAAMGIPLKAAKVGSAQTLPVVKGHEEALLSSPQSFKKTIGTTLKIAPGVVTAPVGMAADVGLSVGRVGSEALHAAGVPGFKGYTAAEILDPIKGQAKAQAEFAREVEKVVTSTDSKYVKSAVENHLGLLLPAMAAPTLAHVFKPTYARVLEKLRRGSEGKRLARGLERRPVTAEAQHVFPATEGRAQRIEESKRAATTKLHAEIETQARSKPVLRAAQKVKGPKVTVRQVPAHTRLGGDHTRDVTIDPGEAVGFLARHGITRANVDQAVSQIKHVRDRLDPATVAQLPKSRINTLDITNYLVDHSEVLKDPNLWEAVDHYKGQAKTLQSSEAARVQPVMEAHHLHEPPPGLKGKDRTEWYAQQGISKAARQRDPGVRHFERVPIEIRHLTNATTRRGVVEEIAKDRARLKRAAVKGDKAEVHKIVQGILAKHNGLYRNLSKEERKGIVEELAEEGVTDPAAVRAHLKEARLQKAAHSDTALEREYLEQAKDLIAHYGYEEPAYATQADVRTKGSPSVSAVGGQIPKVPAKVKQRTGQLQRLGAIDESLPTLLRESIRVPVARKHIFANMRDFMNQRSIAVDGKREFTSAEAGRLIDNGRIDPRRNILIPRQLYKKAFDELDKGDETGLATLRDSAGDTAQAQILQRLGYDKGRRYMIVPKEAATEFFAQTEKLSGSQHVVSQLNRATSRAILGLSPSWAAMQLLAEGAQATAAVNPYRMIRGLRAFKKLPEKERHAFQAWAGETPGVAVSPKDVQLGLRDGSMNQASDAFGVANKTAMGRALKDASTAELLGILDRKKGGIYRRAVMAGKIDRDLNSKMHRFTSGMQHLWRDQDRVTQLLKDKPLPEQLAWFTEHPAEMKKMQNYLDDVMGNWNALTRHERTGASVVMFYPFLRMSLRWLIHSYPKQHPIKAAILYYLGQQNANELHKLLHGDPSFFNWAMTPLHTGEGGEAGSLIDFARAAPGANALTQGLGATTGGPWGIVGLQVVQPWLASVATAVTGVAPLGGEQKKGSFWQGAAAIVNLALPARLLGASSLIPGQAPSDSPSAEAFRKEGSESPVDILRKSVLPVIPKPLSQERRKVALSKNQAQAGKNPIQTEVPEAGWEALRTGEPGVDKAALLSMLRARKAGEIGSDKAKELEEKILGHGFPELDEEEGKWLTLLTGKRYVPIDKKEEAELKAELLNKEHPTGGVLPKIGGSGAALKIGKQAPGLVIGPPSRGKIKRKKPAGVPGLIIGP